MVHENQRFPHPPHQRTDRRQARHPDHPLLETIGRKTGQPRVIPIAYFFHEGIYLIVASNWGKDKDADWYLNLLKNPHAKLTVNGKTIPVEAHAAQGDEYTRLWKFAAEKHPPYLNYQKMTSRHIPIVVFQASDSQGV